MTSYSIETCINTSKLIGGYKLNEVPLSNVKYDYRTYLDIFKYNDPYVTGSVAEGPFTIGGAKVYPYSVRSVILIGVKMENGKAIPSILHVDPNKFKSTYSKLDTDLSNSKFSNEMNPISKSPLSILHMPGTRMEHIDFKSMGENLRTDSPIDGCPFWGTYSSSSINWSYIDGFTAGHHTGYTIGANGFSVPTLSTKYSNNLTKAHHLFYMNSIVEYMQKRYGYVTPDPLRPYSPVNWLKVSTNPAKADAMNDGSIGNGSEAWFYYKILYLPEFDYYMHIDIYANHALMTSSFVKSEPFKYMIKSLGDPTIRNPGMIVGSAQFGYGNTMHKSNLINDETMISGQYVYGTDYKSKLFLHNDGRLSIIRFPTSVYDSIQSYDMYQTDFRLDAVQFLPDLPFNCSIFMQKDKNIVIYANGKLKYDYTTTPAPVVSIYTYDNITSLGFKAIAGTGTQPGGPNSKKTLTNSTFYAYIIHPGGTGASIMCNNGTTGNYIDAQVPASGALDSKYPTTDNDEECVNNWTYKGSQIYSTTSQDDSKPWCFKSWLVTSDYSGTGASFDSKGKLNTLSTMLSSNAKLQITALRYGTLSSNAKDAIRGILYNSDFIKKAISLGFLKSSDPTIFSTTNMGYCMRGNRLLTDPTCKVDELVEYDKGLLMAIDDKLKRICVDGTNDFCKYIKPSDVHKSLFSINPRYAEILLNPNTYYNATTNGLLPLRTDAEKVEIFKTIFVPGALTREQMELIYPFISSDSVALSTWKTEYKNIFNKIYPNSKLESSPIDFKDLSTIYSKLAIDQPTTIVCWKSDTGIVVAYGEIDIPYISAPPTSNGEILMNIIYNAKRVINLSDGLVSGVTNKYPSTKEMALADFSPGEKSTMLNTIYDYMKLNEIHIFYKSLNRDVVLKSLKALSQYDFSKKDPSLNEVESVCKPFPELCVSYWNNYITTKAYDVTSDAICDKVLSSITGDNKNLTQFEKDSAQALLPLCTITNARSSCSAPEKRYKKDSFVVRPSRRTVFESFATDSCGTICNNTTDPALMAACELGSVSYCTQNPNNQSCTDDAKKYPSVMNIMKNYCPSNPTSQFCKNIIFDRTVPIPTSSSTPIGANASASTSMAATMSLDEPTPSSNISTSSSSVSSINVVKSDAAGNLYISTQPALNLAATEPAPVEAAGATITFSQSGGTYTLSGTNLLSQNTKYNNEGYKAVITVLSNTKIAINIIGTDLVVGPKIIGIGYDQYEITNSKWEDPGIITTKPTDGASDPSGSAPTTSSTVETNKSDKTTTYIILGVGAGIIVVLAAYWYNKRTKFRQSKNDIIKNRENIPRHSMRIQSKPHRDVHQYTSSHPMSRVPKINFEGPLHQSTSLMSNTTNRINSMFSRKHKPQKTFSNDL
jgi:hypothetical protein